MGRTEAVDAVVLEYPGGGLLTHMAAFSSVGTGSHR
jgi:hypothetical protein